MVSDSLLHGTGFGKQARAIATYLASQGHEVHALGWQHYGMTYPNKTEGWTMHGCQVIEEYGERSVPFLLRELDPDVVISLGDFWMLTPIAVSKRNAFWIMYFTLDSLPFLGEFTNLIDMADVPIAMSKFGYDLCIENGSTQVKYIPHVYGEDFKRLPDEERLKCRDELSEKSGIKIEEDDVVFCTIARMLSRKNLPFLIKAMSEIKKKRPNIKWYLHTDPEDPHRVFDLSSSIFLRELQDITIIPPDAKVGGGMSDEKLNRNINACDIHILLSGGEGFCVPVIETGITGIPSILTNYSTGKELAYTRGERVKVAGYRPKFLGIPPKRIKTNMKFAVPDIDDAVKKAVGLIDNKEQRIKLGKKMMEFVKEFYSPEIVLPKWDREVRRCRMNIEKAVYEKEVLSVG